MISLRTLVRVSVWEHALRQQDTIKLFVFLPFSWTTLMKICNMIVVTVKKDGVSRLWSFFYCMRGVFTLKTVIVDGQLQFLILN